MKLSSPRAYNNQGDFYPNCRTLGSCHSFSILCHLFAIREKITYEKMITYQPYLNELVAYVRKLCPKAKVYIHQTWAYEAGSQKLESVSFPTPEAMFAEVEKAYAQAAADICADGIIPSGKLMLQLSEHTTVHRDTFHASLGIGRLALGLLWYTTLSGQRIADCTFRDTDEPVDEALVATAIGIAESLT